MEEKKYLSFDIKVDEDYNFLSSNILYYDIIDVDVCGNFYSFKIIVDYPFYNEMVLNLIFQGFDLSILPEVCWWR